MSTLTDPEELRKRIALAKAATPGPWVAMTDDTFSGQIRQSGNLDSAFHLIACMPEGDDRPEDFSHIAANSPDVVIALCEALLAAQEALNKINEMDGDNNELWEAVDIAGGALK